MRVCMHICLLLHVGSPRVMYRMGHMPYDLGGVRLSMDMVSLRFSTRLQFGCFFVSFESRRAVFPVSYMDDICNFFRTALLKSFEDLFFLFFSC